jgi:hypothetical protein
LAFVAADESALEDFPKWLPCGHAHPPQRGGPLDGPGECKLFQSCLVDRALGPPVYPVIPAHKSRSRCWRKEETTSRGREAPRTYWRIGVLAYRRIGVSAFCRATASFCVYLGLRCGQKPTLRLPQAFLYRAFGAELGKTKF